MMSVTDEICEYLKKPDCHLLKVTYDLTYQDYSSEKNVPKIIMCFGTFPHYPDEEMLEVTFYGCSKINLYGAFDFIFQPFIIFEDISDRQYNDLHYYVREPEDTFSFYCDNIEYRMIK